MAVDTETILATLAALQNPNSSAIQLYRAKFATPENIEQTRFWVQRELDDIQLGFASTDEVVRVLAGLIEQIITGIQDGDLQGEQGEKGDTGPAGPSTGRRVYTQTTEPFGADEGDIWLKVRS